MVLHLRNNTGAGGGGGGTPGGADTQVQFNDGGAFGGDAGLVYDKTTDKLTVGGDIDLDDGGTFSTTLQTVTPTANRTVSIPDATGTIGLVNGPTGSIQFNEAGALNGTSDFSTTLEWDDSATTFTGLKLNVTDTFSLDDSKLLDLQVNGTSRFRVETHNTRVLANGYYFDTTVGYYLQDGVNGVFNAGGPKMISTASLTWVGSANANSRTIDLNLFRDAANTFAQRNGTNAQTYRLYNTYTDASNYERGFFQWNSDVLEIGAEGAGTGSEQPVRITAATLKLPNLPTYADNTAATSGGLVAGDVYKTATGELRITV